MGPEVYSRHCRSTNLWSGRFPLHLILNGDSWISIDRRYAHAPLSQQLHVILHSPSCLIKTILHGVADAAESGEIGGVEAKVFWIGGRLDDQRIRQINHDVLPLSPAAFKMAWQVPVGTSLLP